MHLKTLQSIIYNQLNLNLREWNGLVENEKKKLQIFKQHIHQDKLELKKAQETLIQTQQIYIEGCNKFKSFKEISEKYSNNN